MKNFVIYPLFCLFLLSTIQLKAQFLENRFSNPHQPYQTNWKLDAPLLTFGLGLFVSQRVLKSYEPLDLNYVRQLHNREVIRFDHSATKRFSQHAQKASDIFLFTSMAAPTLLMFDPSMRKDWKNVSLIGIETFSIGIGLTLLAKNLVHRPRPFLLNENIPAEEKLAADGSNSFFSGHTAYTALSTFMMAKLIVDYHPNTKFKPLIWTLATAIPATTGLLRYKAGKHYFTDIITGFTVGALTGVFVPFIHQKIKKRSAQKEQLVIDYFGRNVGSNALEVLEIY